jgi:hypothetical protein
MAAGFSVNAGLHRALEEDPVDLSRVRALIALAKNDGLVLDQHDLGYLIDQRMKRAMVALQSDPRNTELLDAALDLARNLREFPFRLNLWQAQNIWHDVLLASPQFLNGLEPVPVERWRERFLELGRQMYIAVEQLVVEDAPAPAAERSSPGVEVSVP